MNITNELQRISAAKADLKSAINARGGNLTSQRIDAYAAAVERLPIVIPGGATVSNLPLGSGSAALIESGASAVALTVARGATVTGEYGGSLVDVSVSPGGSIELSRPDAASGDFGVMLAGSETEIAFGTLKWNGSAFAGSVSGGVISDWDGLYRVCISSGITVSNVNLNRPYGRFYVYPGALVLNTSVGTLASAASDAELANIGLLGGSAAGVTVNYGGCLNLFQDGAAENIHVNSGFFGISAGPASASGVSMTAGRINDYGTLTDLTQSGGSCVVFAGGIAASCSIEGGKTVVSSGGVLKDATVCPGGSAIIMPGATAREMTVQNGGGVQLSSGASWSGGSLPADGSSSFTIPAGAVVTDVDFIRSAGDYATVFRGYVSGTLSGGTVAIHGGNGSDFNKLWFYVNSSGLAKDVTIAGHARLQPQAGGRIEGGTVETGGAIYAFSSGSVSATTIENGGKIHLANTTSAMGVVISSGGIMVVSSGAKGSSITVHGSLHVASGGSALEVTSMTGAVISAAAGAVITYAE